ncbi:unnamed protein product [Paramecium pentaurelia]|uniref:Uncharacterized protein n=1 Tax=Paramecium pentaurelia TaxID=43138 RepID=A0A8S1W9N3_9CILI|nr:unnamed protein product [Paramecium pentaurelia]
MIIVGINIIILLYLGANFYAPELLKSLLNKYKEYTNIIQERMQDLTLFQNVIYNSIFFLISFPYMSSEFTIYSKVNWSYFRFFNTISASYRYLQFLEAILLLTASFLKPTLAAYPLNLFAFILIYEISIQEPFFFKTVQLYSNQHSDETKHQTSNIMQVIDCDIILFDNNFSFRIFWIT